TAHACTRNVPEAPLVSQAHTLFVLKPCRIVQLPLESCSQNSYKGFAHPEAEAVQLTTVPAPVGEETSALTDVDPHSGVSVESARIVPSSPAIHAWFRSGIETARSQFGVGTFSWVQLSPSVVMATSPKFPTARHTETRTQPIP